MPERLEVQRAVAASASEIFAVLTDPRGHVAIDSSGMLMAASGDIVAKAGDTFVVHMDREALNDYPLAWPFPSLSVMPSIDVARHLSRLTGLAVEASGMSYVPHAAGHTG